MGIFLSSGYDSSAVASILQKERTQKIKTFTIGFEEGNNEAVQAKAIAQHLGTDHTEYFCRIEDTKELIDKLPEYYDEPFADSSALPTMLVSKLARQNVTVALSGDGGDEIFAGYQNHAIFNSYANFLDYIPKQLFPIFGKSINLLSKYSKGNFQRYQKRINSLSFIFEKGKKYSHNNLLLTAFNNSLINYPDKIYSNHFTKKQDFIYNSDLISINDFLSKQLYIDYRMYMQDDILVKVDRASMYASLEAREPFLDHRLIEYVAQLPSHYKLNNGCQKRILKDIVHKYIPKELLNNKKAGFTIPVENWLKTDLKYYLDNYLDSENINRVGVFDSQYIDYIKKLFLEGKSYVNSEIWKLLQFHMWYEKWM